MVALDCAGFCAGDRRAGGAGFLRDLVRAGRAVGGAGLAGGAAGGNGAGGAVGGGFVGDGGAVVSRLQTRRS